MVAHAKKKAGRPKRSPVASGDLGGRQKILDVATRLFAQKGLDGVTVQDIVSGAETNLSMVSYYFGGKEGLYFECIERAAKAGLESSERILSAPKTEEEFLLRLRLFIEEIFVFHIINRDVTTIVQREMADPDSKLRNKKDNGFFKIYQSFESYFAAALKAQIIRKDVDLEAFCIFYFNSIVAICKTDCCASAILGLEIDDRKFRDSMVDVAMSSVMPVLKRA